MDNVKWISVKERLPKTGEEVLVVWAESGLVTTGDRELICHNLTRNEISHWAEKPAPPDKEERDGWIRKNNPMYSPFETESEEYTYICRNCGNEEAHKRKYCPECGEKMRYGD